MVLEHNTSDDTYKVLCENCNHAWEYEGYEIVLEPYPHFECPACGEWIPVF